MTTNDKRAGRRKGRTPAASGGTSRSDEHGTTGRKRDGQTAADRGVLLQQIMDTASVAIFLVDKSGRISHANRRMSEMFGRPPGELVGLEYVDLVHPSEREVGRKKMLALLASEIQSVDLERHYRRKDGTEFWGHLAGRRFHDIHGNELGLIGVITDIDKRKQAENRLRESESRLNTILDNVGAAIFIKDTRYRYTYVNRKVSDILGLPAGDILGKGDDAFFVGPSVEEIMRSDRPVIDEGRTVEREEVGLTAGDGHPRTYWTVKLPLRDAGGAITGLCGISTDITEYRRAEEALRASEAKYRRLYNETPVLMHSIDREGILVEVSDHWLRTLGYERHEVIGRKVTDFYTEASARYAREVVQPAFFRDGIVRDIPYQFVKKNGEIVDVLLSATGERDAGGRVVRSQAVIEDVTERKRADEALRESEEKFSKIFQKAPLLITLSEVETGRYFEVNEKFLEVSGYARDEVMGRTAIELGWISDEQRARLLQDLRERGRVAGMELSLRRKDGGEVICLYYGELITVGGTQRLLSIAQDITERKTAERQLAESQRMLRNVIDSIPVRVFWKDRESRYLGCNNLFAQDAGRPGPDSLLGEDDFAMGWAEQAELYRADDREVMRTGIPKINYEEPQTTPAGDRIWLRTSKIPLRDAHGTIYGILGTYEDITESKMVERALNESRRFLETIIESAPT